MKWWYYLIILALAVIVAGFVFVQYGHSQTDPPIAQAPSADVQALQSQLAGAGCNAALNAAANEIIRLRKQVAQLQAAQIQGKSGATKH